MNLLSELGFVKIFIDNVLAIGRESFEEHINYVSTELSKMKEAGSQINIQKSQCAVQKLACLGHIIKTK